MNKYLEKIAEDGIFKKYVNHLTGKYEAPHREHLRKLETVKKQVTGQMDQVRDVLKDLHGSPEHNESARRLEHALQSFHGPLAGLNAKINEVKPAWQEARSAKLKARGLTAGGLTAVALTGYALHKHRKDNE